MNFQVKNMITNILPIHNYSYVNYIVYSQQFLCLYWIIPRFENKFCSYYEDFVEMSAFNTTFSGTFSHNFKRNINLTSTLKSGITAVELNFSIHLDICVILFPKHNIKDFNGTEL